MVLLSHSYDPGSLLLYDRDWAPALCAMSASTSGIVDWESAAGRSFDYFMLAVSSDAEPLGCLQQALS